MKPYIFNLETTKIELHFEKSEYAALSVEQKSDLKSAFLWSRTGNCWVSRAKEPNLWRAKQVAAKLGFTEEQRQGERLSFSEQVERQAERAEKRAERYEQYAENAERRGVALQQPLNRMHGDIAFFTQPIIAGHAGSQAFARQRERMFAKYEKGFEEYRKSSYFQDRARTAKATADGAKYRDVAYLDRRIKECRKEIRAREKNIIHYEQTLYAIENGEKKKQFDGAPITAEVVNDWIKRELELVEKAMDKQAFLEACVDQCGGIRFSKDNIKIGFQVRLNDGFDSEVEVIGAGPQNITYRILTGGAKGMVLQAAYAEIKEIIKAEELRETHPFTVGEQFTAEQYVRVGDSPKWERIHVTYEIIKATSSTIRLKPVEGDGKAITRKPRKSYNGDWCFSIDDSYTNTFHKAAKVSKSKDGEENAEKTGKI
nr:DUF3560 domain-containing protein [uncultured Acetatifactor sp.]